MHISTIVWLVKQKHIDYTFSFGLFSISIILLHWYWALAPWLSSSHHAHHLVEPSLNIQMNELVYELSFNYQNQTWDFWLHHAMAWCGVGLAHACHTNTSPRHSLTRHTSCLSQLHNRCTHKSPVWLESIFSQNLIKDFNAPSIYYGC